MQTYVILPLCLAIALSTPSSPAATIAADWQTTSSGILNGVTFSTTGFGGPFLSILNRNYSGSNFSAAPVGAAEALEYSASDNWSITFAAPITNLLLVVDWWRGDYRGGIIDPTSTYTFNQPLFFASGMSGASISGNILSLPDIGDFGFFNGVLRFSGPVNTLSMNAQVFNGSGQVLTFAVDTSPTPEPTSVLLLGVGLFGITIPVLRKKAAQPSSTKVENRLFFD